MKAETIYNTTVENLTKNYDRLKQNKISKLLLSKENIILLPAAVLLGRASLLGGLMPFGIAFYAASAGLGFNSILIAAGILSGMFTGAGGEQIYITISAMFLFNVFNMVIRNKNSKLKFIYAVISFISVTIPGLIMVYLQGFLLYDLIKSVFLSFMVFCLVFIFRNTLIAIREKTKRKIFSNEEIISIAITAAFVLSGMNNIQVFGISIRNILCIIVILLLSYRCGSAIGAAIGVAVGLVISLSSDVTPVIIGSYAVCGLLAGIFRNIGRIGACLGFVIGNALLTLHINGSTEVLIHLKEIITAIVVFVFIPKKHIELLSASFNMMTVSFGKNRKKHTNRIREHTVKKLKNFSRAFNCISRTYDEIAETKQITDKQDISLMLDRVACKVCKNCSLCNHCWNRNFYSTYQALFKIVEALEIRGRIGEQDIPQYFIDHCERVNDFVKEVNNTYEIFKIDMVWKNKISENRKMLSQQLDGLSEIISNLALEINSEEVYKGDIEYMLQKELNAAGIKVEDIAVYENKWEKYEITIAHKGCNGKRECVNSIEGIVSTVTGRKMRKKHPGCVKKMDSDSCLLKLVEEEELSISMGVTGKSKENTASGDNYTFLNTEEGKYIIALSDGMGTGQRASMQSNMVINLIEELIESGFDAETTIRMINSVLLMKSNEEEFATIDLSIIDLYNGDVEFVKIGAAPTYIKKHNKIKVIKTVSLPAGLIGSIDTELIHYTVENGDFIVMLTDGVYDSFAEGCKEDPGSYLSEIESINPQEIAEDIMQRVNSTNNNKIKDDMTVLVAKVWDKL